MHNLKEPGRVNKNQDEVELAVLFDYIRRFFRRISRGIRFMVHALYSNLLLVLGFVAVGLLLGYSVFYTTKPYYTSSMTMLLSEIRNEFVEDQFNTLSQLVTGGDYEAVASRLDISPEAARQIKAMSFSNVDTDKVPEDSVLTGSPFRVQVTVYNPALFNQLQPAITNYLENNEYFSKQKRIRQRQLTNMVTKLKGEIKTLDSLKASVVKPTGPVNGFVYGEPIDPTSLSKQSMELFEQQVELESALEQIDNIQLVTGFAPQVSPTGPLLPRHLSIGGTIAFLLGFIVALTIASNKARRLA